MKGIPAELNKKLRQTWRECISFEDIDWLRDLFAFDERISLWHDHLPALDGLSQMARIERLVDFLCQKTNSAGENGLVLFLLAWQDELDPDDDCYRRLAELAGELAADTPSRDDEEPEPGGRILIFEDLKVMIRPSLNGIWHLQVQNVGQRPLKNVAIWLHPGEAIWTNKSRLAIGVLPEQVVSAALPFKMTLKRASDGANRVDYTLGVEVIYQPQSGGRPVRKRLPLDLF